MSSGGRGRGRGGGLSDADLESLSSSSSRGAVLGASSASRSALSDSALERPSPTSISGQFEHDGVNGSGERRLDGRRPFET